MLNVINVKRNDKYITKITKRNKKTEEWEKIRNVVYTFQRKSGWIYENIS